MPTINGSINSSSIGQQIAGDAVKKSGDNKQNSADKINQRINQHSKDSVSVDLSAKALEVFEARARAFEIARNTPDVNEDRVAELRAKVASGDYKIDAEKVADGLMKEAIFERLAALPED